MKQKDIIEKFSSLKGKNPENEDFLVYLLYYNILHDIYTRILILLYLIITIKKGQK